MPFDGYWRKSAANLGDRPPNQDSSGRVWQGQARSGAACVFAENVLHSAVSGGEPWDAISSMSICESNMTQIIDYLLTKGYFCDLRAIPGIETVDFWDKR